MMPKRFLAWLFTIAALLRLGLIWLAPAWYDENFSLILSRLPMGQMLAATAGDVHPPLYYLLIWPLGQLHAPIWVLRIPGALLSLASVWLFWRILVEFDLPVRVQSAALILMAIMPIQLYYAQEARMYSLLEFLVLAACLAMLQRRWSWFGVLCALMLWTQYYAIFYIAALGWVALIRLRPSEGHINFEEFRQILLSLFLAGFTFLPWVVVLQNQMHNLSGNYWMQLTGPGMPVRVLFENLFMPPANAVTQIPLMLVCFAWLIGALIYAVLHRPDNLGSILWLAFLPFGLAILFSLVWQPVLHYRPLIGISSFLYILLALPVQALYQTNRIRLRRSLIAAIFIVPLLLVTDGSQYAYARSNKLDGTLNALAYVEAYWQPGDIVYHFGDDSWINSVPYDNLPNYRAPDCGITLGELSPATRAAIGEQMRPLASLSYRRAWLLWSNSSINPACSPKQLTTLGLDPQHPLLVISDNEYIFYGLWLLRK